jgi:hypothetical protein
VGGEPGAGGSSGQSPLLLQVSMLAREHPDGLESYFSIKVLSDKQAAVLVNTLSSMDVNILKVH